MIKLNDIILIGFVTVLLLMLFNTITTLVAAVLFSILCILDIIKYFTQNKYYSLFVVVEVFLLGLLFSKINNEWLHLF